MLCLFWILVFATVGDCKDGFVDVFKCDNKDIKCRTDGIMYNYGVILKAGMLTPICINIIQGQSQFLTYKFTNTSVNGLKNCTFVYVRSSPNKLHFRMNFICPLIKITGQYSLNGYVDYLSVIGTGNYTITLNNYNVTIDNFHNTNVGCKETYLQIVDVLLSEYYAASLTYDMQNLRTKNIYMPADPNEYFNANKRQTDFLKALWYSTITKIMESYNIYLESTPTDTSNMCIDENM